jgi:hypothetical protein
MKILAKALCALSVVLLCACNGAPVKLGEVTDVSKIDRNKGEMLESSAGGFQLMLFIPLGINSRYERAYADLKAQAGPDRMLSEVSVAEWWYYAVIGTVYETKRTAMAYPKIKTEEKK